MLRKTMLLSAVVAFSVIVAAARAAPPDDHAETARAEQFKRGVSHFVLRLEYRGVQDRARPFNVITLSVPPILSTMQEHFLVVQITQDEAAKLIDKLAEAGVLSGAANFVAGTPRPDSRGYDLFLGGGAGPDGAHVAVVDDLGWGPTLLQQLAQLRGIMPAEGAKAIDTLTGRLTDLGKQWEKEGRVFERNGLAVLIKPAKLPVAAGEAPVFDVTVENTNVKQDISLYPDPSDVGFFLGRNGGDLFVGGAGERWRIEVVARSHPTPSPLIVAAGKSISFKLALDGCSYLPWPDAQPPHRAEAIKQLPSGKYKLTVAMRFPPGLTSALARPDEPVPAARSWLGEVQTVAVPFEVAGK